MRRTKIVTHNGSAHRDEFLACCAIIYHEFSRNMERPPVERRLVTPADLSNDGIYVIDTGGQWNPRLLNFDHHQAEAEVADKCALDLVLAHLMPHDDFAYYSRSNDWLRLTAMQDTRGASETATTLGVSLKTYSITRSPIEIYMLRWFADASTVHPDSPLWLAMLEIGRGMLSAVPDFSAQQEALRALPGPMEMFGVRVWDIRAAWASDARHGHVVVNDVASKLGVDVVVGHNLRNNKVGLYRQEWAASKLDLSKTAAHPKHFSSHQNGFYAVVESDVKDYEILELIRMAVS